MLRIDLKTAMPNIDASSMQRNEGLVLLPVILLLTVLAIIALLSGQENIVSLKQTDKQHELAQVRYTQQAALALAQRELKQNLECENYSIINNGSLNEYSYSSSLSADNGSPINLTIEIDFKDGKTQTISKSIKMYEELTTEAFAPIQQATYIESMKKNENKNSSDQLSIMTRLIFPPLAKRHSLLQFDLSAVDSDSDDDKIISAILELHSAGTPEFNKVNIQAYSAAFPWVDSEATFIEYKAGDMTGFYEWDPIYNQPMQAETIVDEAESGWKEWDITTLTKEWLDGSSPNYGVAMISTGWFQQGSINILSANNLEFHSDNVTDTSKRPRLRITRKLRCECGEVCN